MFDKKWNSEKEFLGDKEDTPEVRLTRALTQALVKGNFLSIISETFVSFFKCNSTVLDQQSFPDVEVALCEYLQ